VLSVPKLKEQCIIYQRLFQKKGNVPEYNHVSVCIRTIKQILENGINYKARHLLRSIWYFVYASPAAEISVH
jgi:hypothetical protein